MGVRVFCTGERVYGYLLLRHVLPPSHPSPPPHTCPPCTLAQASPNRIHLLSKRMVYPTFSPTPSPRSAATRSATETAEMRRGWVHTTRQPRPEYHASSRIYCGTCT